MQKQLMSQADDDLILKAKKKAAQKAVEFIQHGMIVGLGSGSTACYFIDFLAVCVQDGLQIEVVASSEISQQRARQKAIPVIDINSISEIDITVDGADEIDPEKRLIKGKGGALLREKILASMSREMVVIADETKLSKHLGSHLLPVEILPFGYTATIAHIHKLGLQGTLRLLSQKTPYLTDNGNYILDLDITANPMDPSIMQNHLCSIPGVIETGFFLKEASRIIIGYMDGSVVVQ